MMNGSSPIFNKDSLLLTLGSVTTKPQAGANKPQGLLFLEIHCLSLVRTVYFSIEW